MGFNDFNQQLREDVQHIQIAAAQMGDVSAQIGRVQNIMAAAMICLEHLMGPAAAAHWLRSVAEKCAARATGHVH